MIDGCFRCARHRQGRGPGSRSDGGQQCLQPFELTDFLAQAAHARAVDRLQTHGRGKIAMPGRPAPVHTLGGRVSTGARAQGCRLAGRDHLGLKFGHGSCCGAHRGCKPKPQKIPSSAERARTLPTKGLFGKAGGRNPRQSRTSTPSDAAHQASFSGKLIHGASAVGPARDPSQYIADSIRCLNRSGFAYGTPWPTAEISGVWAYTLITSRHERGSGSRQGTFLLVRCMCVTDTNCPHSPSYTSSARTLSMPSSCRRRFARSLRIRTTSRFERSVRNSRYLHQTQAIDRIGLFWCRFLMHDARMIYGYPYTNWEHNESAILLIHAILGGIQERGPGLPTIRAGSGVSAGAGQW